MMRLIDADAIKLEKGFFENIDNVPKFFEWLGKQPTVYTVKYGRWVKNDNGTYSCSLCQSWIPQEQHYYANFCLRCGAKMDEVE